MQDKRILHKIGQFWYNPLMHLYHATPQKLDDEYLTPRTKNVQLDADGQSARLTDYNDENTPYVFAATDSGFAATYAVPRGTRLGNYRGLGDTNLLFVEKESIIGDANFHGGLYIFPDTGFVPLFNKEADPTEQMVSPQSVDLTKARFEPIANLNDLMGKSVQVYQIADQYSSERFHADTEGLGADKAAFLKKLHSLMEEGNVRWLNKERGLNPVQSLISGTKTPQIKTGPSFEGPALEV